MTPTAIRSWFENRHWQSVYSMPYQLVFQSGAGMPEGYWREARIRTGVQQHLLEMWVLAWNGHCRHLHPDYGAGFMTESELEWLVAQLGPKSFAHIIDDFACVVGPAPTEPRPAA